MIGFGISNRIGPCLGSYLSIGTRTTLSRNTTGQIPEAQHTDLAEQSTTSLLLHPRVYQRRQLSPFSPFSGSLLIFSVPPEFLVSSTFYLGENGVFFSFFINVGQKRKTYLTQSGLHVNSAISFLQEMLQQYKLVGMKFLAQQRDFQALIADFEVSEGIYLRACIEDADSVCLWLEANVMLEYSCDKVNMARVYNWDVHQCRSCWYFYRFMKQKVYYSPDSELAVRNAFRALGAWELILTFLHGTVACERSDPIRFLVGKRDSSKS